MSPRPAAKAKRVLAALLARVAKHTGLRPEDL